MCPTLAGLLKVRLWAMSKGMKLNTWYKQVVVHERSIYQPVLAGFQIGANIKISGGFFLRRTPIRHWRLGNKTQLLAVIVFFQLGSLRQCSVSNISLKVQVKKIEEKNSLMWTQKMCPSFWWWKEGGWRTGREGMGTLGKLNGKLYR